MKILVKQPGQPETVLDLLDVLQRAGLAPDVSKLQRIERVRVRAETEAAGVTEYWLLCPHCKASEVAP